MRLLQAAFRCGRRSKRGQKLEEYRWIGQKTHLIRQNGENIMAWTGKKASMSYDADKKTVVRIVDDRTTTFDFSSCSAEHLYFLATEFAAHRFLAGRIPSENGIDARTSGAICKPEKYYDKRPRKTEDKVNNLLLQKRNEFIFNNYTTMSDDIIDKVLSSMGFSTLSTYEKQLLAGRRN